MSKKAYFINSAEAQYSDHEFAWFQSLVLSEGVLGDPDSGVLGFEVTENDTPDMSVLVAPGKALVQVAIDGRTFKVVAESDAEEQIIVGANSSGANRVDAVIVRVDVDVVPNETKSNVVTIEVLTGSGATALTDGAIDTIVGGDGWYRLADITVPSSTTNIENADIADVREKVAFTDGMTLSKQFIQESAGAVDELKIPALNENGELDPTFNSGLRVLRIKAGENMARGDSAFISMAKKVLTKYNVATSTLRTFGASTYYTSNTYTSPNIGADVIISKFTIYSGAGSRSTGGTNFGQYTGYIYAVDGSNKPTGSPLASTTTVNINTYNQNGTLTLTFVSPYTLTKNTKYAFVVKYNATDSDEQNLCGGGSPADYVTSHNSSDGVTWTTGSGAFYFKAEMKLAVSGKSFKTSAKYYISSDFKGFVLKDVVADEYAYILTGEVTKIFSSLTPGSYYYLSNTNGQISTSPGTISKKVAYSFDADTLSFGCGSINNNTYSIDSNEQMPFDGMVALQINHGDVNDETYSLYDENGTLVRDFTFGVNQYSSTPDLFQAWFAPTLFPVKKGWYFSNLSCILIDDIKIL